MNRPFCEGWDDRDAQLGVNNDRTRPLSPTPSDPPKDTIGTQPLRLEAQRSEQVAVLARQVSLLEQLLDDLFGLFPLRWLLEGVGGDGTLETLELESVTSGHQVVVVDDLR